MHTFHRFLRDPAALERTRTAFDRLLAVSRISSSRSRS
jgi:hypothetical protein